MLSEPFSNRASGGRRRYVVELRELGRPAAQTGDEGVSAVVRSIERELRDAAIGELSVGKVATTVTSTECTIYVGLDATDGASIAVRALPGGGPEVWLIVSPSSKLLRYGVWVVLGVVGLATGVVLEATFPDLPRLAHLAGGLLGGGLVAVAVQHTSLLAGERARELTDEVDAAVVAWREGLATARSDEALDAVRPPKRKGRKKRRKPKKRARPAGDRE